MVRMCCEDLSEDSYTDAAIQDPRRFVGIPLAAGQSLADRFPVGTKLVLRSDGTPSDFFMAGPMLVISERLKAIFGEFGVAAEFFPVELTLPSGRASDSRWFFQNILAVVDCLDWEKSQFTSEKGFATNIQRILLSKEMTGQQPLFRVARTIPSLVCASDELAAAVTAAGCTGLVFKKPEEWRNPMNPI